MPLSDVFNVTFEPDETVPPGKDYELHIDDVRLRESASGRPTAVVFFRVVGGGAPEGVVGKTFPVYFVLEGRGTVYLRPLLLACGYRKLDGQVTFEASKLVGKIVVADVGIERSGDAAFYRLRNLKPTA